MRLLTEDGAAENTANAPVSRVRCVISADRALAKDPVSVTGIPIDWDHMSVDPGTRKTLVTQRA